MPALAIRLVMCGIVTITMKGLILALSVATVCAIGCQSGSDSGAESTTPPAAGTPSASTPSGDGAVAATFTAAKDVLTANCTGCHSGSGAKEGLDLSTYESVMKGGEHGPVVKAGDPDGSMIIKAMRGNGAKQMPPGKPLPEDKIKTVEDWIRAGAKS